MQFTIEKDIPVTRAVRSKYPLVEMKPGDSFFVPAETDEDARSVITNIGAAKRRLAEAEHCHARDYVCSRVEGGVRCWRVSDRLSDLDDN